jgi:hypothetical protein
LVGKYFHNLEQMRSAARKASVPFWNIVLATAHFGHREVTHADFRFQAYTTLAYGGRGLAYFTYFAPGVGNYRMAPIDQFGEPTQTWYFMQNVNRQVLKLAPTINKLTSDDVYHFGTLPLGTHAPDRQEPGGVDQRRLHGRRLHARGRSRWVMIVNRDVTKPMPCLPTFRARPSACNLLSPYTGQLTPFEGEQVWLARAPGCLLEARLNLPLDSLRFKLTDDRLLAILT